MRCPLINLDERERSQLGTTSTGQADRLRNEINEYARAVLL
jgi:hypothetical protein